MTSEHISASKENLIHQASTEHAETTFAREKSNFASKENVTLDLPFPSVVGTSVTKDLNFVSKESATFENTTLSVDTMFATNTNISVSATSVISEPSISSAPINVYATDTPTSASRETATTEDGTRSVDIMYATFTPNSASRGNATKRANISFATTDVYATDTPIYASKDNATTKDGTESADTIFATYTLNFVSEVRVT